MATMLSEQAAKLNDGDPAVVFKAYKEIEEMVTRAGTPGKEEEAAQLADALAAELNAMTEEKKDDKGRKIEPRPIHSSEARGKICRLMAYVAGAKQVPALAQAIGDLDVREMARWALDRNTSDAATDALIKALDEIGPRFRVGVVNALAKRNAPKASAALRKVALEGVVPEIRIQAVEALSNYPDGDSGMVIMKTAMSEDPAVRARAYKAAVRLAGNMAKMGKKDEATGLCRMIASGNAPDAQKAAAQMMIEKLK